MTYESPIIRPPSEWRSGLLRVTRGCHWNRCRFCGIYPHLGQPDFSVRSPAELREDIQVLQAKRPDIDSLFLGDADPLHAGMDLILEVLEQVRTTFALTRITSYARFSTLYRLGPENLSILAKSGLSRIHLGLESGDDQILRRQRKGQNQKMVRAVTHWLKEAGMELSVYVLLGLGGKDRWQEHAQETAMLLNQITPQFIRIRRLHIYPASPGGSPPCPLSLEIKNGVFNEQSPEGTVLELELLLEQLQPMASFFTCDHSNNYLNLSGSLDKDREDMLAEVRQFLALPESLRELHYSSVSSGI